MACHSRMAIQSKMVVKKSATEKMPKTEKCILVVAFKMERTRKIKARFPTILKTEIVLLKMAPIRKIKV